MNVEQSPTLPQWVNSVAEPEIVAEESILPMSPWITLVWDDPVNLMPYVTYVFRSYFGYSQAEAQKLMMQVHKEGKAVVSTGSLEEMQRDVEAMHGYGLQATFRKDGFA